MNEMPPNNNGTQMETKPTPPNFRMRFFWFVAAHVVVGVLAGFLPPLDYRSRWQIVCIACILAGQISLLGIWGGLGGAVLWKRLIGVMFGMGYLTFLLIQLGGQSIILYPPVFIFCGTASMVLVMLIVRPITGAVCHESSSTDATHRRQFSIRQLFVLTTVVAFLAAALKLVFPLIDGMFVVQFVCFTVYAVISIIPLWCVLASKRPVVYGLCVVAVEAYLASVLGHISNPNPNSSADVMAMTFMGTQATYVVFSLLIVRSWGYRLMPMRSRRPHMRECPK